MKKLSSVMVAENLFKFFRSVKLTIVLILIIILTSLISTLIPQNKDPSFYTETYRSFTAWLILSIGYNNFFRSVLFLLPSLLFFINLFVCTYDRLRVRIKRKAKKRFGPDILHIGLLVLIIGGMITFIGKKEAFIRMEEGDKITLSGGYTLILKDFEFLKYDNGRPKDWISTVDLEKDGKKIEDSFAIEVNRPLKAGKRKIYQISYNINKILYISDPGGTVYKLKPGQIIPVGDDGMVFRNVEAVSANSNNPSIVFEKWVNKKPAGLVKLSVSDKIDVYTIKGTDTRMSSGLQIVEDPGYYTIMIGLILLTLGLFITYYQKLEDNKL